MWADQIADGLQDDIEALIAEDTAALVRRTMQSIYVDAPGLDAFRWPDRPLPTEDGPTQQEWIGRHRRVGQLALMLAVADSLAPAGAEPIPAAI